MGCAVFVSIGKKRGVQDRDATYHTRIRIDDKDDLSNTDVALSPSQRILLQHLGQGLFIHIRLLLLANRKIATSSNHLLHVRLHLLRDVESKVHVGSLLELALADVALVAVVLRTRDPADVVVFVELSPRLAILLGNASAESVIVDEDVGRPTVGLVVRDGLLERSNGGNDDRVEALLVDGHLDGDPRRHEARSNGLRQAGFAVRIEAGVGESAADGADHLQQTGEDGLEEEQTDDEEQRRGDDECEADVVALVQQNLLNQLGNVDASQKYDA
jgi:hypothetical protein